MSVQSVQDRAKFYANKNCTPWKIERNDYMFSRVKPQHSDLKPKKCQKLSLKFCGPFIIIIFLGKVAYLLDFPKS